MVTMANPDEFIEGIEIMEEQSEMPKVLLEMEIKVHPGLLQGEVADWFIVPQVVGGNRPILEGDIFGARQ
jgi:hypothetical protein